MVFIVKEVTQSIPLRNDLNKPSNVETLAFEWSRFNALCTWISQIARNLSNYAMNVESHTKNQYTLVNDPTTEADLMTMPITDFYRLDPLTGSHNLLSFVETLDSISAQEQKPQLSILYADLNYFYALNEKRGHAYGDSVIHWLGIVLQEESNSPTFRIGGDKT